MYKLRQIGVIYCHMGNNTGCGNGGWTQVLKIDGRKVSFNVTFHVLHSVTEYSANVVQIFAL